MAIAIVDAVGAKEREQEKQQAGSGLRRIFGRSKEKGSSDPMETRKHRLPDGGRQSLEAGDQKDKTDAKDKLSRKTSSAASKPGGKRRSLD